MRSRRRIPIAGAFSVACALVTIQAEGQTPAHEAQPCIVHVTPEGVDAGLGAVEVTARTSRPIGSISALETPDASGIRLASAAKLRRIFPDAGEDEKAAPIRMDGAARATLWLDLLRARSGTFRVTVRGEKAACSGRITVRAGGPA